MAGYGQGQGQGGGYPPPPMGGFPQYNYPPNPTPTFPNNANAQSPLYTPQDSSTSYNSYLNNMMPTPQHHQTSSSTSSEFQPTQSPSTASLQTNSQSNSGQINIDISEKILPASTIHYGEAPKIQPRRYKQQKVTLSDGHFIYDCPVSTKLTKEVPLRGEEEFDKVRYTACTCDPDDFQKEKYLLRQQIYGRDQIEIFIVITMYNEEAKLFARTFYGVVKNIHDLCKRERSKLWGKDGWKKVVVCVVSDGFEEIDKTTKAYLSAIGAYQEGVVKKEVNKKPVTAHIFEYTTQLCLDPDMKPVGEKVGFTPIQVLFCLKEENTKKINSHRWFFNAFGRNLNPNVCILLDAGTKPGKNSIYHLWKAFDTNPNIGGACGEIVAMKGKHGKNLLNPFVAAQNFEYKMSNILDKPLESVFGYITVLPGAFSAYRYRALLNQKDPDTNKEVGPLASYFLGEKLHAQKLIGPDGKIKDQEIKAGLFEANMYLAEDRILCFELISKKGDKPWLLHYVKSASAETDVPDNIVELIKQRRRWLNGSFFASLYSISHTSHIWGSPHSVWRKIALLIEMLYQTYNVAFSWFALGNIYLTFHILGNSLATDAVAADGLWSLTVGSIIFNILRYMYIALIIFQFALALGNKPKSARWAYIFSTVFFAFLMIYMLFAAVWITYKGIKASQTPDFSTVNGFSNILKDSTFRDIVMSLISTYGLYFLASFLFFEPYHMFHSFVQYMLLVPFYINVLNVYAFCNIHDVSWGTKGDPKKKVHDEKEKVDVKEGEEGQSATVAMPENIDDEYERIQDLLDPKKQEDLKRQEKLRQEEKARNKEYTKEELKEIQQKLEEAQKESNAMFRTYVVFSWMVSNIVLIALITNFSPSIDSFSPDQKGNIYFAIILWSVAILAAIRFFGSCIYLILRLFTERLFDNLIK